MASYTFAPIRLELSRLGVNRAAIDNLELALRDALTTTTSTGSETVGQDDLDDLAATLRSEIQTAIRQAVAQAHLLDFVPFTRDEIIAIVDNIILTEGEDALQTEGGDNLLLEG